jgi:hypothetical protein
VWQQFVVQPRRQLVADFPHLPQGAGVGGVDQPGDLAGQGGGEFAVVMHHGLRGLFIGDAVRL